MAIELRATANTRGFQSGLSGAERAARIFDVAIGNIAANAIPRLAQGLAAIVERSGPLGAVTTGFGNLATSAGLSADTMLNRLRPATLGMVNDFDLMKASNNALTLGIVQSEADFAKLAGGAVKLGRALGLDARQSIDSVVTGIGRQSALMLDNLGIVVKAEDAYKKYAEKLGTTASKLSEVERQEAFTQAATEALTTKVQEAGDAVLVLGDRWEQVKVKSQNAFDAFVTGIDSSSRLRDELDKQIKATDNARDSFQQWGNLLGTLAAAGGDPTSLVSVIRDLWNEAQTAGDVVKTSQLKFENFWNSISDDGVPKIITAEEAIEDYWNEQFTAEQKAADLKAELTRLWQELTLVEGGFKDASAAAVEFQVSLPKDIPFISSGATDPQAIPETIREFLRRRAQGGFIGFDIGTTFDTEGGGGGSIFEDLFGSLTGSFKGFFDNLKGIFTGGGGFKNIISSIASTFLGPLGGLLTGGFGKIFGGIKSLFGKLFGGPSSDELAGRDIVAKFEQNINKILNQRQLVESGNIQWKNTTIAVRDAYLALGMSEQQAMRDVEALWASSKTGAAASEAAVARLEAIFMQVQAEMDRTGLTFDQLRAKGMGAMSDIEDEVFEVQSALTGAGVEGKLVMEQLALDAGEARRLIDKEFAANPIEIPLRATLNDQDLNDLTRDLSGRLRRGILESGAQV